MSDPNLPEPGVPAPYDPTAPVEPTVPLDPTAPLDPTGPFELDQPFDAQTFEPLPPRRRKRPLLIAAVAAGTVAVLGGGAFAAWWFLSGGGPQPEEALPASTIAMISVDLDPSAGQKIEAIKALRKFPKFKDELDIDSKDDLREYVFDKALGEDCEDLDFEHDVKPWIGERAAFAVVDLDEDDPVPTIALAISDREKARVGVKAVLDCVDDDDTGFAIGEDYMILSDSQKHADKIFAAGKAKPLSENESYKKITDKVGDRGVVNFFVSKDAADVIADLFADEFADLGIDSVSGNGEVASESEEGYLSYEPAAARTARAANSVPAATDCDPADYYRDQFNAFDGMAGTVRFSDGGMELEAVSLGATGDPVAVGSQVQKLPADSAIAYGASVPEATIDSMVHLMDSCEGGILAEVEDFTGLDLPEDLKTLVGTSLTLSVGEDFPEAMSDIDEPSDVPVGLVINGDANKIADVIDRLDQKLQESEGESLKDVGILVKKHGDKVIITPSDDYADALAEEGTLGDSANFKNAVPEASRATGLFYLNFDSTIKDALLDMAKESGEDREVLDEIRDNIEPLSSLGFSSWQDGDESHFLLKVATS